MDRPAPQVLRCAELGRKVRPVPAAESPGSARCAALAQLVEHRIRNARVACSSHAGGTTFLSSKQIEPTLSAGAITRLRYVILSGGFQSYSIIHSLELNYVYE